MKVAATIKNSFNQHRLTVQTGDQTTPIHIDSKSNGFGSSVNGAELLLAALATCYCNDIYREAAKRNIQVSEVEVFFTCEFGAEGESGGEFEYKANVVSNSSNEVIADLLRHTDEVAEIHHTLRRGVQIKLVN